MPISSALALLAAAAATATAGGSLPAEQQQRQQQQQPEESVAGPAAGSRRDRPEFSDPAYWERRYREGGKNASYEWFMDSEAFVPLLAPHLAAEDRILQLGCGNSRLAEVLAGEGYRSITSVDISAAVIEASQSRYPVESYPALKYIVGDVLNMSNLPAGGFDAVLDKGTWDAIPKSKSRIMLREVRKVLWSGGLYFVLTFSKPSHALDFLLDWRVGWTVDDVLMIPNPSHSGSGESLKFLYLYRCRNQDRGEDWQPPQHLPDDIASAFQESLEFQRIDRSFSARSDEL